jgi:putative membrane protein
VTASSAPPPANATGKRKVDLSATRTTLAAERTLMSWIRTALSMIGFGFTIFKFLHGLQQAGNLHLRRPEGPRIIGIFLTALGTGSLFLGIVEHVQTLGRVRGSRRSRLGVAFYAACAVLALGAVVFLELVTRSGPL